MNLKFTQKFSIFKPILRKNFCNEGFPKFTRSDIFDEDDLIINIGDKEKFKGLLVICPTPIGNINDISLRQYEALRNGDILACEDTRKTGKLLELVKLKKMKEKFYAEFGVGFEEFVDRGGLDMTDEQIEKEFLSKMGKGEPSKENENCTNNLNESGENINNTAYGEFYRNEDEIKQQKNKEVKTANRKIKKEFTKELKKSLNKNKQEGNLSNITTEINLNYSEKEQKEVLKEMEKKLEEPIDKDYYTAVKDSQDFYNRKTVIENSEDIKEKIEKLAEIFDEQSKLSYKLKTRAKFIMGLNKKYSSKKNNNDDDDDYDSKTQEELEEEISLGSDDSLFTMLKKRIKEEKEKRGRGMMVSFNQDNEEKKIPKLIRAMKLGLRVVLVSDAGTPTISDPGYKLVREAAKNNILMEALPGPSAVLTSLSASALPTDKFTFVGYLSKTLSEKKIKLEEIKRSSTTTVLFESPHRLLKTLEVIADIFGAEHRCYLGFELTKKFENHMHGKVGELLAQLVEKDEGIKGEVTIVLGPFMRTQIEVENQKLLNEEIKIDAFELAEKLLNGNEKLPEKTIRHILMDVGNMSSIKASKIINNVLGRKTRMAPYIKPTIIKDDRNIYVNSSKDTNKSEIKF
jgi:16S rRNA (cytidine(1402)-2'-O)-methyltransferase